MLRYGLALCTMGVLLLSVTSCSGQSEQSTVFPQNTEPGPHTVSRAILDWEAAAIQLPLDSYGMTIWEQHEVIAALSVVFARCVTETDAVSSAVINEAREALKPISPDPNATHWLFGVWDAPYVAEHGWNPIPEGPPHPLYVPTDQATAKRCMQTDLYLNLGLITTHTLGEDQTDLLTNLSGDSYTQTMADSRYMSLIDEFLACGEDRGYQTSSLSTIGELTINPEWSEETTLRAMIVAAECNDQLSLTQAAGDIMAAFQMKAIQDHEAELLAIKQLANERVALAEQILQEVGVV